MKAKEMTREAVLAAVEAGAGTMTEVVRGLGYKSVCGGTTRRIRELVPDVGDRLKAAKGGGKKTAPKKATTSKAKPSKATPATKGTPKEYPRDPNNPFREGSAYGACYDILAHAGDRGMDRAKLVEELARVTGKEHRKAYFDVTVVCSSRPGPEHGGDGGSHRCIAKASDSFWVAKRNGHVTLHLRDRRY